METWSQGQISKSADDFPNKLKVSNKFFGPQPWMKSIAEDKFMTPTPALTRDSYVMIIIIGIIWNNTPPGYFIPIQNVIQGLRKTPCLQNLRNTSF